jgi:hypothetical protein
MVVKNREYAAMPSIQRYVVLAQDVMGATVFERVGEDWVGHALGPDSLLSMPEIDVEVPIAEFYEGVDLPPPSAEDGRPGCRNEARLPAKSLMPGAGNAAMIRRHSLGSAS